MPDDVILPPREVLRRLGPNEVVWRGETIPLSPQEMIVLRTAYQAKGRFLPHQMFYDALWGGRADGGPEWQAGSLKQRIMGLRRKLVGLPLFVDRRKGIVLRFEIRPQG